MNPVWIFFGPSRSVRYGFNQTAFLIWCTFIKNILCFVRVWSFKFCQNTHKQWRYIGFVVAVVVGGGVAAAVVVVGGGGDAAVVVAFVTVLDQVQIEFKRYIACHAAKKLSRIDARFEARALELERTLP